MELRVILDHFPNRADWEKNKLSKLRDSIRVTKTEKRAVPVKKAKMTYQNLEKRASHFEYKAQFLERELQNKEREIQKIKQTAERGSKQTTREEIAVRRSTKGTGFSNAVFYANELKMILVRMQGFGFNHDDAELVSALESLKNVLEEVLLPIEV